MRGMTESASCRGGTKERVRRGLAVMYQILLIVGALVFSVTGCHKATESERTDVEFSVMTDEELPEELLAVIEKNMEKEMRLTWMDGEEMYLIRGYGKQVSGGYSVAVAECAQDEETLWFDTRLIGPPDEESRSGMVSCPYLVVKIAATEKEVVIE